ncbi:MAG: hypothetical protein ACE5OZ_02640 [Candidatus Heimdallarchaeota archaeon]
MFIDTQLWVFAKKEPIIEKFVDKESFQEYRRFHQNCQQFLLRAIREEQIWLTLHQIAEIYHSLSFKGMKLPRNQSHAFLRDLENQENVRIVDLRSQDYNLALQESTKSGIHVWDYLCVLPLTGRIRQVVSCDKHFQHESLRLKGSKLVNPIEKWFLL